MKTMTSRFDGNCATCYGEIKAGEEIGYDGKARHIACVEMVQGLMGAASESLSAAVDCAGVVVLQQVKGSEVGRRLTVRLTEEGEPVDVAEMEDWPHAGKSILNPLFAAIDRGEGALVTSAMLMMRGAISHWAMGYAIRSA